MAVRDEEMSSRYVARCDSVVVRAADTAVKVFQVAMRGSLARSIDEVFAMRGKSLSSATFNASSEVSSARRKVTGGLVAVA